MLVTHSFLNLDLMLVKILNPLIINHFSKYLLSKTHYSITPEELISTVKILPSKQSYGYDEIPMSVIRCVIHSFA